MSPGSHGNEGCWQSQPAPEATQFVPSIRVQVPLLQYQKQTPGQSGPAGLHTQVHELGQAVVVLVVVVLVPWQGVWAVSPTLVPL